MSDNEYDGTFDCTICGLEKGYHEEIFETQNIMICDECNVEGVFQECCKQCDRIFSDIELEFLINKFNKVIECVQCLSNDKDKKLELSYYNFKYLNKKTTPNTDEKYKLKFENEELLIKVNKLLEISNSQNIDDAINTFSIFKKENSEFIKIIQDNPELTCPEDIAKIINEKNKYKSRCKYVVDLLKKNDIIEEDKFLKFLENYKNTELFKNKEKKFKKDPPNQIEDEFFIDYKHKINEYKLKKLLLKNKEIKEYKEFEKINSKDKHININELNSLHNNITESYINILDNLDLLEKEAKEIEKVLPIFDKLKNNINIVDKFIVEDNELSKLFSKLNNDKINEYNTMNQIGKNIIENNLDDDYINKYIQTLNDRKGRLILKCKRIYLMSKHINIEAIALSGISHFIRDSHINTFNCLIDLLKTYISVDLNL